MKLRRWTTKATPRRQRGRCSLMRTPKTIGGTRKQTERLIGHAHHVGLATIPSSLLRVGPVRSPCLWDRYQTTGETNCFVVRVTSRNVLVQSEHFLHKVGTHHCGTYCLLLHNTRTWPSQSLKIACVSRKFVRPKHLSATVSTIRNVKAATRWAVALFKRVYCMSIQTTPVDRVAGQVAWFSLLERLIFQSVSKNISARCVCVNWSLAISACGDVSLASLRPRLSPFDTRFTPFHIAFSRSQAPSMMRCANS